MVVRECCALETGSARIQRGKEVVPHQEYPIPEYWVVAVELDGACEVSTSPGAGTREGRGDYRTSSTDRYGEAGVTMGLSIGYYNEWQLMS